MKSAIISVAAVMVLRSRRIRLESILGLSLEANYVLGKTKILKFFFNKWRDDIGATVLVTDAHDDKMHICDVCVGFKVLVLMLLYVIVTIGYPCSNKKMATA
ncbi:hypothetical protein VNO78_24523 [Psophocarpus tetragonolobus]|uniref:Uncharacterized protein n=1 Tax=Psophocarpus tetragonolobus TaxID=3891 RepID=A0AAN9XED9_PSOTE